MRLIKLDATKSTNSFLKELASNSMLDDYTVAVTNNQTSGRGQMNTAWHSEPYKNLTFSIFTPLKNLKTTHQAYLNFAISLAIYDVLFQFAIPNLSIKWPNDILSANKKICGILIETTFSNKKIKNMIMGIGLNVNQEIFSKKISNASSLKIIMKKDFDLEILQFKISLIENGKFTETHNEYHNVLYRREIPTTFIDKVTGTFFMGKIQGIASNGKIKIQLDDDSIKEFGLKQISFAKA
ncbi:biotin--[acetyl-CoA-carboxylase] ligase [Flavobacteriaceae bacterium]|nr:biotin--[acetyl-CoA-carboxylase] ligase [Flavobacteriaceae bacterium]